MGQALASGSHGSAKLPWLTAALAAGLGIAFALLGPAPGQLLVEPGGDWLSEPWRLLTGHFVHADRGHLGWNLAALLLLGVVGERLCELSPGRYLGLLVTGALAVDLWLFGLHDDLARYCGLSGVLNGLFAWVLIELWRRWRSPWPIALLLAVEAHHGGALLPTTSWQSVPGAHLAGLLTGVAWAFLPRSLDGSLGAWRRLIGSARPRTRWRASDSLSKTA